MAKELAIMMVGDILLIAPEEYPKNPGVTPVFEERRDLFSWVEKVAPVLQQGSFTLGNLEGPIADPATPSAHIYSHGNVQNDMRMPPEAAGVLKRAGFTAVSTSNNHMMNMGGEAMLECLRHLDKAGVAHAGSGRNIFEARKPAMMKADGVSLAFLAYSSVFVPGFAPAGEEKPGIVTVAVSTSYEVGDNLLYSPGVLPRVITRPNPAHVEEMLKDVKRAKAEADVVVVSWHWGYARYSQSYSSGIPLEDAPVYVLDYQEEMGRAALDAGADIVMGAHPHRLEGIEIYKNKPIFYSLANLVTSFRYGANVGSLSVIIKAYIDASSKKVTRCAVIPIAYPPNVMEPYVISPREAGAHIAELERLSRKYGTRFRVMGDEIAIEAGVPEKLLSARPE